jgi:hypothetical protein
MRIFSAYLVAAEDHGDVLAHAHEVAVPVGHVLVRDARGHVKHDDRAIAPDASVKIVTNILL